MDVEACAWNVTWKLWRLTCGQSLAASLPWTQLAIGDFLASRSHLRHIIFHFVARRRRRVALKSDMGG
jgi:hypothetical protein